MSERQDRAIAMLGRPDALLLFQVGSAALAWDSFSSAGDLVARVAGISMYLAISTTLAFSLVPTLKQKRQPLRLVWIAVFPVAGYIILRCLPTLPEPRGFAIESTPKTPKKG